jgi:hypothetical protein
LFITQSAIDESIVGESMLLLVNHEGDGSAVVVRQLTDVEARLQYGGVGLALAAIVDG